MIPRPNTNRLSSGSVPNSHSRQSNPRSHAHSLSVGSLNSAHRIDRRRKSTSSNTSVAAAALGLVAESLVEANGTSVAMKQRSRVGAKVPAPAYATSLPTGNAFGQSSFDSKPSSSAVLDGPPLESLPETEGLPKGRGRRASDGSRLARGESRQIIVCDTCGKAYKHNSCLVKHRWEHTPEWGITSKFLISKHQQVQLLEAAKALLSINQAGDSDVSSPDASSSDHQSDSISSAGNSPPPQGEDSLPQGAGSGRLESKRFSSNSSLYSQSYQSSLMSETNGRSYVVHSRQLSSDNRPTTSGTSVTSYTDDDREEMSAAFNLLSCSFGTPRTGPVVVSQDVPPVPPLPAKYLSHSADHLSGSTITGVPNAQSSFLRGRRADDVEMVDEEDAHWRASSRSDDEEEGMFGKMEE